MPQCYEFNYTSSQPQPLPDVWVPCPVGDNCCIGTDTCLSNNICHAVGSSKNKRTASYSSYYNARCTDPTYTNPACDKICIGSPPDIVYNYTSSNWACCGNNTAGEVNCDNPLHEYYEAPAPRDLATLSSGAAVASTATLTPYLQGSVTLTGSTTSTVPSTSASSSTIATTSPSSPSVSNARSSVLSTGAIAGICVGGVAALVVLAFILFCLRRRYGRYGHHGQYNDEKDLKSSIAELHTHNVRSPAEMDSVPLAELHHQPVHSNRPKRYTLHELSGWN